MLDITKVEKHNIGIFNPTIFGFYLPQYWDYSNVFFIFASKKSLEQYSKILDRMRVLSTKYASEAFEDNDSLRLAYGALIFNACRETCLPLYMEAYREYCNY